MHQSAAAVIVTHDNQILLQRRDDKPGIFNPGKLALFGGYMEAGEEPAEAVVRELEEELGATLQADELIPVCDKVYQLPNGEDIRIWHFLWFEKTPKIQGFYEGSPAIFGSISAAFDSGQLITGSTQFALENARDKLPENLR